MHYKEVAYWVKSLNLMEEDRNYLLTGQWLNDKHISAGMKLLKEKYPEQNGLLSTQLLAKKLEWKANNIDFVQVVHVSGNHWVCISNKFSAPGVCDVYDSMSLSPSPTLNRQVAAVMKWHEPSFTMRFINVQIQSGASDCGLFALAFAVALCEGKDPHNCLFDQTQMRNHLAMCFEKCELTDFPASTNLKPRRSKSSVKLIRNIQVYCTCRLPWDKNVSFHGDLAQCIKCRNWYHQKCLNIPARAFLEQSYSWCCTLCSL